jgi:hypothetical protein
MQEKWKQCSPINILLKVVGSSRTGTSPGSSQTYKRAVTQSCAPQKLYCPPTRAGVTAGRGFGDLLSRVLCAQRLMKGMQGVQQ